ncbi:MAG TPA: hypothetical protein EYO33_32410, partial [Phycisphaerales bacterium]|nr:hypothetical protein [Phycisphaerales bacterium]
MRSSSRDGVRGGVVANTISVSLFCLLIPLVAAALKESDRLRREIHSEDDYNKLDKAYQIARRETSRRQEHEQELYQERRRFEGLVTIAQGLAQEREESQLLKRIVEVASRGALVLKLHEDTLVPGAEVGLTATMVESLRTSTGPSFLDALSDFGQPLVFGRGEKLESDPQYRKLIQAFYRLIDDDEQRAPSETQIRQLVAVPLGTAQDERPFGLLFVMNQNLDKP